MGIVYCGPYADEIGHDRHEGYAARILPDGTETGTWSYETRAFTGYRAHCDCGWRGLAVHPPTDEGEERAEDEWDDHHIHPMIDTIARKHTVTGEQLLTLMRDLRGSLGRVANDHGENVLTDRSSGVLDAVERVEQFLDDLARGAGA
ncbi:hypothetical protein [Amycolatopsis japonica]|uniref:hypothetical protein n=1 Tax=Amycolatopsis japonica TaxID=208439 RepID=UPI0033E9B498